MIEALKSAHLTITPNKEEWERLCRVLLNTSKNDEKKVEWERLCRAFGLTSGDEDALSEAPRLAKVT